MLPTGTKAPLCTLSHLRDALDHAPSSSIGQRLVLIFFPPGPSPTLASGLARFGEQHSALTDQGGAAVGISTAATDALADLAIALGLPFPLLSDPDRQAAAAFGALGDEGEVLPTVYVLDEDGVVRAAFDSERYPSLPNPAAVTRALRKLNDAPRPVPVSDDDWRLGPADADAVLIEYSDYQCGHCRALHTALEIVLAEFGSRLLLVHRHLPLRATHPLAQLAAEAAEAAGAQGRFWEMHHRLFAAEGALEREQLIAYAAELGLDVPRFTAELDGRVYQEAVNEDFKRAVAGGIKLPPTLFINGVLYEGPRSAAHLVEHIAGLG